MCARCAVMCQMESGPNLVRYAQHPKPSLLNLNKPPNSFPENYFLKSTRCQFGKACSIAISKLVIDRWLLSSDLRF